MSGREYLAREIQASVGQRLLWLKLQHEQWSAAYNCPIVCRIDGPLNRADLRAAIDQLYCRHEALRTTVVRRRHELRQVVQPAGRVIERFHDVSSAPAAVEEQLKAEIETPIDPSDCTSRITLWRVAAESHLLCINLHHLMTDTWSCMVLQRELPILYEQCRGGRVRSLPPVGWQFGQFVAYQQRQIAGDRFRRHREYWQLQLDGACGPSLPLAVPRGRGIRPRATICGDVDTDTTRAIRELAALHHVTPFTVLFAIYNVLLRAVTGQSDLTVATLFANRVRVEIENTVGFIANLIMLRCRLDGLSTFADVLPTVQSTVVGAIAHQAFPYHLAIQRGPSARSGRLDRVVFQMLGERIDHTYPAADVRFHWMVPDLGGRFDLELAVMPLDSALALKLHYATDAVRASWAHQFLSAYIAIAAAVGTTPHEPLDNVTAALTALPSI